MLYFCQFKITFPLCCALSKWNFPPAELSLCYSNTIDADGCSMSRAVKVAPKVPLGSPHMAVWL